MAYELMQTMHADASRYFHSLDDIYYYGGQTGHYQVALVEHQPRPNTDELELRPGDRVGVAGNHWDGYSKVPAYYCYTRFTGPFSGTTQ